MTGPIVVAKGVNAFLGSGAAQVHALKDVDLALDGGALTLLMGPSGSGKTTLLSILGCMLKPSSGSVQIRGVRVDSASPERLADIRRRHIGFVFQSFHLFPTLTAAENVRLALDVRGERGPQALARTREVLAEVGLATKHMSFPSELSGGERQRVAIARAIVAHPSIVLADEPTAALDGDNGRAVMTVLAEIAQDSERAVLVVTHDTRILGFAERIVCIEDGAIKDEEPDVSKVRPLRSFRS